MELNEPDIDSSTERRIVEAAAAAEVIEHFIHTKYVGTKRFSSRGATR